MNLYDMGLSIFYYRYSLLNNICNSMIRMNIFMIYCYIIYSYYYDIYRKSRNSIIIIIDFYDKSKNLKLYFLGDI